MKTKEAMEALLEGKKIKMSHWEEKQYIFLSDDGRIIDEKGKVCALSSINDYELYEKPKQTITIEKWLCKGKTGGYYILEASQWWGTRCEKVKLIDTYEVTL